MSLLSRLFGRKQPKKPIAEMPLLEIVTLVQAHESLGVDDAIAAARRLTDIAMFEHGVSDVERQFALRLMPGLDADIERALQNDPGAFDRYQEAAMYHRGTARHYGYGSLQWKMDEEGIEAAEVIPFIARADHAELLPAFLEMMEPDVIYNIRGLLISELCKARARKDEQPLDVLNRLATSGDGALTILLDGRQIGAIGRARIDPDTAEAVLAELGVRS